MQTARSPAAEFCFGTLRVLPGALLMFLVCIGGGLAGGAELQLPAKKTVLVLSTERTVPSFESALREGLADPTVPVQIYTEYLDFARFPTRSYEREVAGYLRQRYGGARVDVIVTFTERAFEYALAHRAQLFKDIPIVAAAVNRDWLIGRSLAAGVGIVPITYDYKRTIELMVALLPQLQEVVIVHGVSDFDERRRAEAREAAEAFAPKLSSRMLGGVPLTQLEDEVRRLPSTSAVLMASMVRNAEGTALVGREFVQRLVGMSPVPIFSPFQSHREHGAVGGATTDFSVTGRLAATLVLKAFSGGLASGADAVDPGLPPWRVDGRALQRWNIPEHRIPPAAQGQFLAPSPWQRYRDVIVMSSIALAMLGLLTVLLRGELSRRRRSESSLRESEMRFRSMADAAPLMIWMSGPNQLRTFFNRAWLEFTGHACAPEQADAWTRAVHADDVDGCLESYRAAFDARREFQIEYRLRRGDGEYRWIREGGVPRCGANGTFLGYVGSCVDITGTKRAAEKLRLALAALPTAVLMVDQQGKIVLANAQAEKLFGYGRDELLGCPVETLVPERLRGAHLDTQARQMDPGRDVYARRKDGSEFMAEIVLNPISSEEGTLVLTAIIDLTEHSELQRSRQELAHVSRVSIMGELAGSLAHELNQPLTAILSNVQAAQRFMGAKSVDLKEVQETLKDVVAEGKRASEIIRRMRALVKKGELEFEPLDAGAVIRDVVALLRSDIIARGVRVTLEVASNLPAVLGDRVQLQQVILNLLLNAFDAMKDKPRSERLVTIQATLDGTGDVRIAVRDRGTGLTVDKLDEIFKPFVTTKREGLGLGLSISRSIVDAHRGQLRVENDPGQGATFYLTLPTIETAQTNRVRLTI